VDINADRLAVTETDRFGNPVGSWVIHCVTCGRTSERRVDLTQKSVRSRHANRPQHRSEDVSGKWDKCACFEERHTTVFAV
jgi:hypothetical protein